MSGPSTPINPRAIHTLLSSLRSHIFRTAHNPTNARTGAKYLRRRLAGPSAVQYYPRLPPLRVLNAETPWNEYANWRGEGTGVFRRAVAERGSSGQRAAWSVGLKSPGEGDEGVQAEEGGKEGEVARKETRWAQQNLPASEAIEPGWVEVGRIKGAGWLDDQRERTRREEVAVMKAMGRGPPKKGQGKRSQMKKR